MESDFRRVGYDLIGHPGSNRTAEMPLAIRSIGSFGCSRALTWRGIDIEHSVHHVGLHWKSLPFHRCLTERNQNIKCTITMYDDRVEVAISQATA
jgi:hypothetical protein